MTKHPPSQRYGQAGAWRIPNQCTESRV